MVAKAKTREGINSIPMELAELGFNVRLNPEPIYYSPDGAKMLVCIILSRDVEPPRQGEDKEQIHYKALVLNDFVNGHTTNKETGEVTTQPGAKPGDQILLSERHQFKQLDRYVGKAMKLAIIPSGKVITKRKQEVWTFQIFGAELGDNDRAMAKRALVGGLNAPKLSF